MRLPTDRKLYLAAVMTAVMGMCSLTCNGQSTHENKQQWIIIEEGSAQINKKIKGQNKKMGEIAGLQGSIGAENTVMKNWEKKYNSYLKSVTGFASAVKAATSLYADGVETLRHLNELRKAVNYNPEGIGATFAMDNLYIETVNELIKIYYLLKESVAKGGEGNMLTGAARVELLWTIEDEMRELNRKLRQLAISIAFYDMADVWENMTDGLTFKGHGYIAGKALERWQKVAEIKQEVFNE